MTEIFDGYVTKYAMTRGIEKMRLQLVSSANGMVWGVRDDDYYPQGYQGEGKQ